MKTRVFVFENNDVNVLNENINILIKKFEKDGWQVKDVKYQTMVKPTFFDTGLKWNFKKIYSALIIIHKEAAETTSGEN